MTISHLRMQTGIKPSVCTPYSFHDQPWFCKTDPMSVKTSLLCHHCVRVGTKFYVFNPILDAWQALPDKASAQTALFQQFVTGKPVSYMNQTIFFSQDDIKAFLYSGIVTLNNLTYAPGLTSFVIFNNETRLNIYKDLRLAGDDDDIDQCEEWLKIVRNSLCAEPDELSLTEMIEEIGSNRQTPFRWVMHWLAARYQIPGFSTGTNLWFLGSLGGVGKGTMVSMLKSILGPAAVGGVNQTDIQKGWTDSMFAKQLLEWDEFKMSDGWHSFNRMLKSWTGNETIMPTARNVGGVLQPAVGMHIFTTNEENPVFVEKHDRRNTMIATTQDEAWAARCAALFNPVTQEFKNPRLSSGFAALLNAVEIDMAFIRKPLETETRTELRHIHQDTVLQWVESGSLAALCPQGLNGEWSFSNWKALYAHYREWNSLHTHVRGHDLSTFVKKMEKAELAKCIVAKKTLSDGSRKSYRRVVIDQQTLKKYDPDADIDASVTAESNVFPLDVGVLRRDMGVAT